MSNPVFEEMFKQTMFPTKRRDGRVWTIEKLQHMLGIDPANWEISYRPQESSVCLLALSKKHACGLLPADVQSDTFFEIHRTSRRPNLATAPREVTSNLA
jgi:hypothetical protein